MGADEASLAGDSDAVIDVVARSPDGDEYVLVLLEERPWAQPGVLDQLADRVNRCVAYVVEDGLATDFPETSGRDIRIHVEHRQPVDADAEALFLRLTAALEQYGIEFSAQEQPPGATGAGPRSRDPL